MTTEAFCAITRVMCGHLTGSFGSHLQTGLQGDGGGRGGKGRGHSFWFWVLGTDSRPTHLAPIRLTLLRLGLFKGLVVGSAVGWVRGCGVLDVGGGGGGWMCKGFVV